MEICTNYTNIHDLIQEHLKKTSFSSVHYQTLSFSVTGGGDFRND